MKTKPSPTSTYIFKLMTKPPMRKNYNKGTYIVIISQDENIDKFVHFMHTPYEINKQGSNKATEEQPSQLWVNLAPRKIKPP
jgi:hypothetical protein